MTKPLQKYHNTHLSARGRDGGVREEFVAGVKDVDWAAFGSIQNDAGLPQGPAGASGAS